MTSMNSWIRFMVALIFIAAAVLFALSSFLKKKNYFTTRNIAATGILAAIEIVLQIIGNFIALGPVSINLCLIPIAIGAIIYGPFCGAFLGFLNGLAVILAPSTLAIFMPINPIATIFLCILKSTLAGLFAGFIYLPFKKNHQLFGAILSSIALPVINTGLFAIGSLLFFKPFLDSVAAGFPNIYAALFLGVIGWNFIFELLSSTLFSPAISRIMTAKRRHNF